VPFVYQCVEKGLRNKTDSVQVLLNKSTDEIETYKILKSDSRLCIKNNGINGNIKGVLMQWLNSTHKINFSKVNTFFFLVVKLNPIVLRYFPITL